MMRPENIFMCIFSSAFFLVAIYTVFLLIPNNIEKSKLRYEASVTVCEENGYQFMLIPVDESSGAIYVCVDEMSRLYHVGDLLSK